MSVLKPLECRIENVFLQVLHPAARVKPDDASEKSEDGQHSNVQGWSGGARLPLLPPIKEDRVPHLRKNDHWARQEKLTTQNDLDLILSLFSFIII